MRLQKNNSYNALAQYCASPKHLHECACELHICVRQALVRAAGVSIARGWGGEHLQAMFTRTHAGVFVCTRELVRVCGCVCLRAFACTSAHVRVLVCSCVHVLLHI